MNFWKKNKPYIIASLVILLGGTMFGLLKGSSSDDGRRAGKVIRGDVVQRVTIAGLVVPKRKTVITAPYAGYVKRLFVKVGQKVEKDAPVVSVVQSLQSNEEVFPMRSPFAGLVVQVPKSEGEFVRSGDPKEFIVRIDDLSEYFVTANVPEIDLPKITVGQNAMIKTSALLDRGYKGVIREISLASKEQDSWRDTKVEYPIKIQIMDFDDRIRPGMSVLIDVISKEVKNVLIVGHEFIESENDKYFLTGIDGVRKEVKVGLRDERFFEILEGVAEGEMVQQIDFLRQVE